MRIPVVGFIPPILGVDGEFNTFRLGGFYAKHLLPGQTVYLLNEREKIVFGSAVVESIEVGKLDEMCKLYAHRNHTELLNDEEGAPERLMKTMLKIYGPHIALPGKKTTILNMKRLE